MTTIIKHAENDRYAVSAEVTIRWDRPEYSVHVVDLRTMREEVKRTYTRGTIANGFRYYANRYA